MTSKDLMRAILTRHDKRTAEQRRFIDDAARLAIPQMEADEADQAARELQEFEEQQQANAEAFLDAMAAPVGGETENGV